MKKKKPNYIATSVYLASEDVKLYEEVRKDAECRDMKVRRLISNIVNYYLAFDNVQANKAKTETRVIIEEDVLKDIKAVAKRKKLKKGDVVAMAMKEYKQCKDKEVFYR